MYQHKHRRAAWALIIAVLFLASAPLAAQDTSKRDLQLGLGFQPDYVEFVSLKIPHIQLSWDYRVAEAGPGRITIGHYFGLALYESNLDQFVADPITYGLLDIGARVGYALNPIAGGKLEPYGGLQYSYHLVADLSSDDDASSNTTKLSVLAGLRYQFSEKTGAYFELNPGYTLVKIGFVFKKF